LQATIVPFRMERSEVEKSLLKLFRSPDSNRDRKEGTDIRENSEYLVLREHRVLRLWRNGRTELVIYFTVCLPVVA